MNATKESIPFELGQTVITREALASLNQHDVESAIRRHTLGDWGDCDKEDWQLNDEAVGEELRLFSIYHDREGTKFWIITEADRSATTVLLPSDY